MFSDWGQTPNVQKGFPIVAITSNKLLDAIHALKKARIRGKMQSNIWYGNTKSGYNETSETRNPVYEWWLVSLHAQYCFMTYIMWPATVASWWFLFPTYEWRLVCFSINWKLWDCVSTCLYHLFIKFVMNWKPLACPLAIWKVTHEIHVHKYCLLQLSKY